MLNCLIRKKYHWNLLNFLWFHDFLSFLNELSFFQTTSKNIGILKWAALCQRLSVTDISYSFEMKRDFHDSQSVGFCWILFNILLMEATLTLTQWWIWYHYQFVIIRISVSLNENEKRFSHKIGLQSCYRASAAH